MDYHQVLCNQKRKRLHCDFDWWQINTGKEGTGKSTFSIWDALFTSPEDFKKNWRERIAYDPDEFISQVETAPKYATIILDEGGEAWYNRDYQSRTNKVLGKTSMQIRDRNLNIEINVPSMYYLDKVAIARHRTWVLIQAKGIERGFAEIYVPQWPKFGRADIPYWELIIDHNFPALPKAIYDPYKRLKSEKARERLIKYRDVAKAELSIKKRRERRPIEDLEHEALAIDRRSITNKQGKFIVFDLANELDLSQWDAQKLASSLNKKYYSKLIS